MIHVVRLWWHGLRCANFRLVCLMELIPMVLVGLLLEVNLDLIIDLRNLFGYVVLVMFVRLRTRCLLLSNGVEEFLRW